MEDHILPTHRKHGERIESEVRLQTLKAIPQWHTSGSNIKPLNGPILHTVPPAADQVLKSDLERCISYLNQIIMRSFSNKGSSYNKFHEIMNSFSQLVHCWIPKDWTHNETPDIYSVMEWVKESLSQEKRGCPVFRSARNLTYFVSRKFTWLKSNCSALHPIPSCIHLFILSLWYFI